MKTIDRIQVPTEAPIFNEPKAVEAGVRLIMASGGRQTLVKMLAMIYLADRRLIERLGVGLTDDEYFAHEGDLAVPIGVFHHAARLSLFSSAWHQHIECHPDWTVKVLANLEPEALSAVEREVVDSVARDYALLDDPAFIDALRQEAPEVVQIGTGHFGLKEILVALGDDPAEAAAVYEDWASLRRVRYSRDAVPS